jgi:hypothetical protein
MYLQKVGNKQKIWRKINIFYWRLEGHWRKEQDPDRLVRGTDLRIQIRNKMSRIRNTKKIDFYKRELLVEEAWFQIRIRIQNIAFYTISACLIFNVVPNLQYSANFSAGNSLKKLFHISFTCRNSVRDKNFLDALIDTSFILFFS